MGITSTGRRCLFCLFMDFSKQVLLGMLKSPNGIQSAAKRQIMLPVLACKLLNRAFAYEAQWPLKFVQVSTVLDILCQL